VPPESVDAVLLTHAHLDHCGLLPKLVKEGFRGKIHCTAASAEIARIILLDAAHLQEEDAEFKKKRHRREGRTGPYPEVPLYTVADAERVSPLFAPVGYLQPRQIARGLVATFHNAGHVFGSSMITLVVQAGGEKRTILFSGDVGRNDRPILDDPETFTCADYVLVESTYGDRVHKAPEEVAEQLAKIINETHQAGGKVIVPSFALERSQELLYHLNELLLAGRIPKMKVFLDSPMAIRITEVFERHPELFDEEMRRRMRGRKSPFDFPGLEMTLSTAQSKAINAVKGPAIIIAGSGMCTGGRIKHHLANHVTHRRDTILFVGYQATGTLGRIILEGAQEVRILGRTLPVEARVARINGFSAHADRQELLAWLTAMRRPPRHVFVVHGETGSANQFRRFLVDKTGWEVSVPAYRDRVSLNGQAAPADEAQ